LLIGVVLEMVALGTLPFGASRYPEWGSASIVGGALYASGSTAPTGHLALATLAALLAAWLSSESMVWLRKLNARWARAARAALETGHGDVVISLQLRGLVADLVRGGFVVALALSVFSPAYRLLGALWAGGVASERAALSGLTAALGGATIWMLVRGTPGARICIGLGVAVGAAMLL
jgi:mannose/fructose/N-acetylgalactosamine-specific phosphotransferase system component IIC